MADDSPTTKQCSVCKAALPLEDFSPDVRATTGRQPACKPCAAAGCLASYHAADGQRKAKTAQYARDHKEKLNADRRQFRADNPEIVRAKKRAAYERVKHTPGYQAMVKAAALKNKDVKAAYDRVYRSGNQELCIARARAWAKANPDKRKAIMFAYDGRRRAQEAGGATGLEIAVWTKAQPKVCYWCGVKCAKSFHRDHYIPLARGGPHTTANLVIACPACNFSKNARDPLAFALTRGRLL